MIMTGHLRLTRDGLLSVLNGGLDVWFTSPSNVKIGLFTGFPGWSEDLVLADLTDPTYTGYAPLNTDPWTPAGINAEGRPSRKSDVCQFSPSADGDSPPVIGASVQNQDGDTLYGVVLFPGPVQMMVTTDDLAIVMTFAMPGPLPSWGESAIID